MSEVTQAVLRMPPSLWDGSEIDVLQRHGRYVEAAEKLEQLEAENARQKEALAEVREVYAGSEGIPVAETCAEAYVIRLIEQMYSIAVEALTPTSAGDE